MKIFSKIIVTLSVIALALNSCGKPTEPGRSTIPFVEKYLTDSSTFRSSLLLSYSPVGSKGSVTLIGDVSRCLELTEQLLSYDEFDNITGEKVSDGLPDFAGETISAIIDYANAPYQEYINRGNEEFLRELNVRNAIGALNPKCAMGPNDKQYSVSKNPAKMIIFVSSYAEDYGKFDTDTLFKSLGIKVPILVSSSVEKDSAVIEECFKHMRDNSLFTHRVHYPKADCYITYPISGLDDSAYEDISGVFSDSYKYTRPGNFDKETFVLVRFSERYLSQEIVDMMKSSAPETYRNYVQN